MQRLLPWYAAACTLCAPIALTAPVPPPAAAPNRAVPYDRAVAGRAIAKLADELERGFLYPEVGRAYGAMLRTKLADGAYAGFDDAEALCARVTADLQAIHPDGHLRMRPPQAGARSPAGGSAAAAPAAMPPPMEQAGWIAPGIAYVRFNAFPGEPDVVAAFARFLDSHADAKALIIDARTHAGGGLAEIDELLSRAYARPATVMVMDTRMSVAREQGDLPFPSLHRVAGTPELSRAEHRIAPRTPVSNLSRARVYYLTGGRTASAAEHLATVLKHTRRATLIGDTTAGAGNYGEGVELPGGYTAFIAAGHSYYPGTDGWEQTGVDPDVRIAPERALVEALTREGIAPAEAERLSDSHRPSGSMARRTLRPR